MCRLPALLVLLLAGCASADGAPFLYPSKADHLAQFAGNCYLRIEPTLDSETTKVYEFWCGRDDFATAIEDFRLKYPSLKWQRTELMSWQGAAFAGSESNSGFLAWFQQTEPRAALPVVSRTWF